MFSSVTTDPEFIDLKKRVREAVQLAEQNRQSSADLMHLRTMIQDLEREQVSPDFWGETNASRAAQVNAQLSTATRLLSRLEQWQSWQDDCQAALEMLKEEELLSEDEREMLLEELQTTSQRLLEDGQRYELELLLSGPYDSAPAIVRLTAGAGGTEANDWVADLKRMYERHCERTGFTCKVEDVQEGEVVGYKTVELYVTGENAYGWMQGEKGAHRLVRLSPFNANNKRQTTFAGVDVAPDVLDDSALQDIDIPDNELEITFMRAGGKGGQNVNKVNTACRVKHLPSGIQVKCTQERSQSMNKDIAMKRLKAQLLAIAQEQRVEEIKQIRGDQVEASWGAQIRNYVMHPYKLVKDQRTGWESSNVQNFLDGDLEDCISSYLRWKAQQQQDDEA